MAKIIGFDQSAKKHVTCKGCAAIVEYTLSETKSYVYYDYGGGNDTYYYIQCPNCNKQVNVNGY